MSLHFFFTFCLLQDKFISTICLHSCKGELTNYIKDTPLRMPRAHKCINQYYSSLSSVIVKMQPLRLGQKALYIFSIFFWIVLINCSFSTINCLWKSRQIWLAQSQPSAFHISKKILCSGLFVEVPHKVLWWFVLKGTMAARALATLLVRLLNVISELHISRG